MIVKILYSKTAAFGFPAVRYNTDKTETGKGELVLTENFGVLQGIENPRPQDYMNYLTAVSSVNRRIRYPQLHAVISCKGRQYTREQLTGIARQWLREMGYGDNPYMLIFHKDTGNNHIHMVSTRVDKKGKKINDSFEKVRAYQVLERILGPVTRNNVDTDVTNALSYNFGTKAQFMMILEQLGYNVKVQDGQYRISKFGHVQTTLNGDRVDERISQHKKDGQRIEQLRAIMHKYMVQKSTDIHPVREMLSGGTEGRITGYSSPFFGFLREKFGLEAVLHFSGDKPPYGYTLIDHYTKNVFKGGDILPLAKFSISLDKTTEGHTVSIRSNRSEPSTAEGRNTDVPDQAKEIFPESGQSDYVSMETSRMSRDGMETVEILAELVPSIDIADDIDDEAIHGRNRRKKRKARTNTR